MIQVGQKIEGKVCDYTYDGLGIVKVDDYCYFVEYGIIGEEIEFTVTDIRKNFAFGKLRRILVPSPHRVKPACKYYYKCGGCNLMHMDYDMQVEFKKSYVLNLINRNLDKNLTDINFVRAENKYHYRNKTVIPFDYKDNTCIFGMYKKKTHEIIGNEDCLIANKYAYKIAYAIKDYLDEFHYYNNVRNVIVRNNYFNKLMVVIVSKKEIDPFLGKVLAKSNPNIVSIVNNINNENTNKILGDRNIVLYHEDKMIDIIMNNLYSVNSKSFFQVNLDQVEKLYACAIKYADLNSNDSLIDAYSGIGSIGLSLAGSVKKVLGIEIVPEAVKLANENVKLNNIKNAKFICGKAEDLIVNYVNDYNALIVDPPRKGLDNKFKEAIKQNNFEKVVYVSCNPSTLIRDIKDLGYELVNITLVDMFPNTNHIECVALIKNLKS